jgi:hypothetical protein
MDVHPTKNVSIGIDPYPYLNYQEAAFPCFMFFLPIEILWAVSVPALAARL